MIIWKFFQLIFATLAGLIVPARVVIPESTLTPPPEVLVAYQEEVPPPSEDLLPAYLQIPSIGVNAAIHSVGLTEKGAVGTPTEPGLLGWFDKSAIPGEQGSAIIDGHRGWRNSTPAVFDNLKDIGKGDLVIVVNNRGDALPFEVYDIQTYHPHESPPEVFAARPDSILLNLITCNGEWDTEAHSATERLVVFTKKVTTN